MVDSEWEDWYKVTTDMLREKKRFKMVSNAYDGSVVKALMTVFPEYPWEPWKFLQVPRGFWYDDNNIKEYLKWVTKQLRISTLDDWYLVGIEEIKALGITFHFITFSDFCEGGVYLIQKNGGMLPMLKKYYPGMC
jgi:hypothetical protein